MAQVEVFSKNWCPYCRMAKALLDSKGVAYKEINITVDASREEEMIERSRRYTVPQIFIDGESIGGYNELAVLDASGELDKRLDIDSTE